MLKYKLIRSKRKTAAIHIRNGTVEVRVPLKMPERDIKKFIAKYEKWIADKLAASSELARRRENFTLDYGSRLLFRGDRYPIVGREGSGAGFDDEVFFIPHGLTPAKIKPLCIRIYRMLAKSILPEMVRNFAIIMNVSPSAIKISGAKTRWGSCSSKKNVNFSWRLIMADDYIIKYVIVHELAHLYELNHSENFWTVVGLILPDYRERKKRLRAFQKRLAYENWD